MHQTKAVFSQEMHCCGSEDEEATLTLELLDGGGGEYLVFRAQHWSFDGVKEIDELASMMKKFLASVKGGPNDYSS